MGTKYVIQDWTGKVCFGGQQFDSFEDAWAFIYENDPQPEGDESEHWFDDYYVEEAKDAD